jgi:PST family polysaccharide transporter
VRRLFARLAGFSSLPVLAAITTLLVLPVVARAAGPERWAALGAGQAIGAYGSTVAFVGWNVLGTPLVAQTPDDETRRELYARSFFTRLCVVGVALIPGALIAALVAPKGQTVYAIAFMGASLLAALGVSWYAVGVGKPAIIAKYELAPKAIASAASLPIVLFTGDIVWYAAGLAAAPLVGAILFNRTLFGRLFPPWPGRREVARDVFARKAAWTVEVTGNLYANAPVPVATSLGTPVAAAGYSSGDKVYRYGLLAVVAVANSLQGWVLEVGGDRRRRNLAAIGAMVLLGVLGGAGLALLGAPVSAILFGHDVVADQATMAWLGVSFFAVSSSTPLIRNVLMPHRQEVSVLVVTASSAVVGLIIMVLCALSMGPTGVAIGLALSEVLTLIAMAVLTIRIGLGPTKGERLK